MHRICLNLPDFFPICTGEHDTRVQIAKGCSARTQHMCCDRISVPLEVPLSIRIGKIYANIQLNFTPPKCSSECNFQHFFLFWQINGFLNIVKNSNVGNICQVEFFEE